MGVSLPLNFSSGPFIRKINLTAQAVYNEFDELIRRTGSKKFDRSHVGNFYSQQYDASLEMRQRQSLRDVAPRLGALVQFTFRNTPFHSHFQASQMAFDANVYLPGFFPHHAIRFRVNSQQDDSSNYHFENAFTFFRGEHNQLFDHLHLWSVDYKMPIGYPDFSILNGFLYFQRLKADVFTEWGAGMSAYNNLLDGHLGIIIP